MNLIFLMQKIYDKIALKLRSIIIKTFYFPKSKNLNVLGKIKIKNPNVKLGNNVTLYNNVTFYGSGEVIIGDNVVIGDNTMIFSQKSIRIGNNSSIAANCYIIDCNHLVNKELLINQQGLQVKEIIIEEDVWIGAGVYILCGSKVPNGCVIGANSTVNKWLMDDFSIYAGCPAKFIKMRE